MLDADAVINNSSQKVGGSNAYPDPAAKKWVGPDPEKHIGSTPLKYSAESDTDFSGIESRFFMFLTC